MRFATWMLAVLMVTACSSRRAIPVLSGDAVFVTLQSSPDVVSGDPAGYETGTEVRATCRSAKDDRILAFVARVSEHTTLTYPKRGACTERDTTLPLLGFAAHRGPSTAAAEVALGRR